jgi:hypothetical protein
MVNKVAEVDWGSTVVMVWNGVWNWIEKAVCSVNEVG